MLENDARVFNQFATKIEKIEKRINRSHILVALMPKTEYGHRTYQYNNLIRELSDKKKTNLFLIKDCPRYKVVLNDFFK